MIRGQNIYDTLVISDTTSGSITLWIMLIMVIGIYIIYLFFYLRWIDVKIKKLKLFKKTLQEGETINFEKEVREIVIQHEPTVEKKVSTIKGKSLEVQEEEHLPEMEIYHTLKRKKWF